MQNRGYPNIHILSKNELAKHISRGGFTKSDALVLVNDVQTNFEKYWKDNKRQSEPEKEKFVRTAKGTPLGRLLENINKIILAPYDYLLPSFIFGGVSGLNHVMAAEHLLGDRRKRVALKMDVSRFFEQISRDRVFHFFMTRCACSKRAASLLADLCCVPKGEKGSGNPEKTIARGFATSSRLAVWCNLDTFIKLERLVEKRLKGKDPRIAIYVDDIGITASRATKEEMWQLSREIENLLLNFDRNQRLPVNSRKTRVTSHEEGIEHLGLQLNRNSLALGAKTRSKIDRLKAKINKADFKNKGVLKEKHRSIVRYKKYVEKPARKIK